MTTINEQVESVDVEFYPDDALPIHHLDDDYDGHQRGLCPYSGASRTENGGCPRGCLAATEHYSNDGHRACHDPAPTRPRRASRP
ncbi:MAG: hypothetical protein WCE30_10155 [Mycobacterium sp.]